MKASYRFAVRGRVQGVCFRQSTAELANRLGLDGWVRNCADGSVEGLVAGEAEALAQLRDWLRHGPPAARVDELSWTAADTAPSEPGFRVRR
ncbi:acylphosphatase [Sinimarinibacterium thermocellulolyticum]|uniref:Acylphosphatase n=1 Tax=Sinimarinibacterium thermocellulolyticum TaxID=3170016 RepID=A0ABV2A7A9_9GAMM